MIKRSLFLLLFFWTTAFCGDPRTVQISDQMNIQCMMTVGNTILYTGTEDGIYKYTFVGGLISGWYYERLPNLNGTVSCMAKSGYRIFAICERDYRIYYTDDDGQNWSYSQLAGTWQNQVTAILTEPPDIVFVADEADGIWRSASNGIQGSWENVLNGGGGGYSIIHTNNAYFASVAYGMYKSINGIDWNPSGEGLPENFVGVALSYDDNYIYAGDWYSIYISTDGGQWANMAGNGLPKTVGSIIAVDNRVGVCGKGYQSTGLPLYTDWNDKSSGLPSLLTRCFAHNDSYVFIGGEDGIAYTSRPLQTSMKTGVEVNSIENGDVWHPLRYYPIFNIRVPTNIVTERVFAGTIGGIAQCPKPPIPPDPPKDDLDGHAGTALMDCPGVLFAGTDSGGIYSASDTGVTWKHTSFGLTDNSITSFTELGGVIYAGTASSGVFRCTVGDTVWSLDGLAGMKVLSLGTHIFSLFAGTKSGVYKKTIGYPDWNLTSLTDTSIVTFVEHDETIWMGSGAGLGGPFGGAYVSTDNGTTWGSANTGLPTMNIRQLAAGGGNIYAATDSGVFRSSDHGSNWIAFNYGNTSKDIRSIAVDDKYVYAGNAFGSIWWDYLAGYCPSSTVVLGGWNMLSAPVYPADPRKISLFPTATSDAFSYNGFYRQEDTIVIIKGYWLKFASSQSVSMTGYELTSGIVPVVAGWNMIGSLSVPIPVSSITSDPPGIKASDFFGYNGSYKTEDTIMPFKGYWLKANGPGNLILSTTQSAAAIAKNAIRIVHTNEMPPPPPDGSTAMELAIPKEYGLQQAYPNPFNPATTIKYELPNDSKVSLKVYNTLGQVVAVLVDEVQSASYKSIEWNAGAVSSGVYFYKFDATSVTDPGKSFVQVKKMLLLK